MQWRLLTVHTHDQRFLPSWYEHLRKKIFGYTKEYSNYLPFSKLTWSGSFEANEKESFIWTMLHSNQNDQRPEKKIDSNNYDVDNDEIIIIIMILIIVIIIVIIIGMWQFGYKKRNTSIKFHLRSRSYGSALRRRNKCSWCYSECSKRMGDVCRRQMRKCKTVYSANVWCTYDGPIIGCVTLQQQWYSYVPQWCSWAMRGSVDDGTCWNFYKFSWNDNQRVSGESQKVFVLEFFHYPDFFLVHCIVWKKWIPMTIECCVSQIFNRSSYIEESLCNISAISQSSYSWIADSDISVSRAWE